MGYLKELDHVRTMFWGRSRIASRQNLAQDSKDVQGVLGRKPETKPHRLAGVRYFQEVLQELVGDKSLEHFRLEYEKLHRALKS